MKHTSWWMRYDILHVSQSESISLSYHTHEDICRETRRVLGRAHNSWTIPTHWSYQMVKVVLWSREGAHLTKPGWSKPYTHSNPTNLALFRHKITLYRFNQGAHTIVGGAQMGAGGWAALPPLTLTSDPTRDTGTSRISHRGHLLLLVLDHLVKFASSASSQPCECALKGRKYFAPRVYAPFGVDMVDPNDLSDALPCQIWTF